MLHISFKTCFPICPKNKLTRIRLINFNILCNANTSFFVYLSASSSPTLRVSGKQKKVMQSIYLIRQFHFFLGVVPHFPAYDFPSK